MPHVPIRIPARTGEVCWYVFLTCSSFKVRRGKTFLDQISMNVADKTPIIVSIVAPTLLEVMSALVLRVTSQIQVTKLHASVSYFGSVLGK